MEDRKEKYSTLTRIQQLESPETDHSEEDSSGTVPFTGLTHPQINSCPLLIVPLRFRRVSHLYQDLTTN